MDVVGSRSHETAPADAGIDGCGCSDAVPPTIPYEPLSDQDDDTSYSLPDDPLYVGSGWSIECLHDDAEDINFEFVYALHTFVATVEGQANATKGDTMVLLDDSNSYWWLVRVVKDSSIGESYVWSHRGRTSCRAYTPSARVPAGRAY